MIQTTDFKQSLDGLLAEVFGVSEARGGEFLDTGRSGLLGLIDRLDAETASAVLHPGDETIAAHCAHLLYQLNLFLAYEQGRAPRADWPASWTTQGVDEKAWKSLRLELHSASQAVRQHLQSRQAWPQIVLNAWMMLLAHVSYHVGVIDKLRRALENGNKPL
jgi:hypothetical protein